MKTQHETTIQFSGYPLRIVEPEPKNKKAELIVVKSSTDASASIKNPVVSDPKNWDVEWFNSYE